MFLVVITIVSHSCIGIKVSCEESCDYLGRCFLSG
jgi:hypothetical protein